jgi:hypothetical protein
MKRLLLVALMVLVTSVGMVGVRSAAGQNESDVITQLQNIQQTLSEGSYAVSALQATANTTNEAVAQPTYPIVCRGGGELSFNYTPFSNFSPNPEIWITFQRGAQKVGSNWENIGALLPGQCSLLDRPVSNNEPHMIIVKDIRNFSISWNQGQVMGISSELSYMKWLQDANRYQSFDVYNDSQGNLILAGIGQAR